ncbi:hypothetical protein JCM3774_002050 [Rhodotorula dairenensis]
MEFENAISEELPMPEPPAVTAAATETDKMLAACIGAVLTSLTMTPFDVIKTRLQTQPPRFPAAFDSLHNSPWPPPVPSTSKLPIECCKAPETPSTGAGRGGRGVGPAKYFNPSAGNPSTGAELLCRFDPRVSRATLPAAGAHGAAAAARSPAAAAAAAAAGAHQYLHHFASVPLAGSSTGGAIACLYPASTGHASLSLPYHLSHASSFAAPAPASIAPNHAHHRYLTGFTDALAHIVKSEGVTALWRGTAPALVMSVPGQVVYMVGYDSLRRTAFDSAPTWAQRGGGGDREPAGQQDGERPPLRASYVTAVPLLAGALSRTVVAVLLSPLELVRTQIQSHVPSSSSTGQPQPRARLGTLLRDLKWSNAWRGLTPTLWRDVPFSGIYWAGYEAIKRSLTGGRGMGETSTSPGGSGSATKRRQVMATESSRASEFGIAFVSGAGSGMMAATLTNPFDVIKTRRQAAADAGASSSSVANSNRTFVLLRAIVKQEGYAGLFAGLTPRLAKVGPACGLMIGCYEAISSISATSRANTAALHLRTNSAE